MPRYLFILTFMMIVKLSTCENLHGQDTLTLNPELLRPHTQYFTIEAHQFKDADTLISLIDSVQFIALGEIHNSRQMSLFTSALLDTASVEGFKHLAVETGPYSAKKLKELIAQGKPAVSAFYDEYAYPLFGIYPVPFFTDQADLDMLNTAHKKGYQLWGVDQEFYFSIPYLLDEIIAHWEGNLPNRILRAHLKLKRRLYWMQIRASIFSSYDMHCRLKNTEQLSTILEESSQQPETVSKLARLINETINIYCSAESGLWGESNKQRLAYFNLNFDQVMSSTVSNTETKVITKMGSYHSGRQKSPLGLYDLGYHIQNWADSLNTSSLHLRFLNRYIEGEDKINDPNYSGAKNFMTVAKKGEWTLIDARALRALLKRGQLVASDFEKREILNYDFILVIPDDTRAVKHY